MSTNVINNSNNGDFIPEVWANRALTKLEAELHLARNVARDSEYTPVSVGDKVYVPKTGALTANQKISGTPVTLQQPSSDKAEVTIDQHWEVSFIVDDVAKAQANQDIMDRYIGDGIVALAEKIEEKLAELHSSLTGGTINSGGGDIEDADLLSARSTLTKNRAPRSNRFFYLDSDQINVILGLKKFVEADKIGTAMPITEGAYGRIYGFDVHESLFVETGGSPTVSYNLAMHRDAMVLAMRPLPTPKAGGVKVAVVDYQGLMLRVVYSYNAQELADQVTIDTLFGCAVLRPELGCVIQS